MYGINVLEAEMFVNEYRKDGLITAKEKREKFNQQFEAYQVF
jgi:hypothetical protein